MTRHKRTGIDETLTEHDKYLGLAREAAASPSPRADIDVEYFLGLASMRSKKPVDGKTRSAVWGLFTKNHSERIKRVETVIARYEKNPSDEAKAQAQWYAKELARLKEWKGPK
jgi:hypothetical protein